MPGRCTVLHTALHTTAVIFSLISCLAAAVKQAPMPTQNIIVSIAMEVEAMPFVEHLKLQKVDDYFASHLPFVAYQGSYQGDCRVTVVTGGKDTVYETGVDNVGTVPAALATYLALTKDNTDNKVLINAGTCGGFGANGASVGDVYIPTAVANHDRRIPIPPFVPYGIGRLDCDKRLGELLRAAEPAWKAGVCTTGNSLDATDEDRKRMKENEATVKDMEAAAIGWSCALTGTPMVGVKVVTDIVDGDVATQEEFMANLAAASKSLQKALPKVLSTICGAPTKDEL